VGKSRAEEPVVEKQWDVFCFLAASIITDDGSVIIMVGMIGEVA
jgi:hypothetical protein